ncbi:MAG: hypothetical protein M3139_09640 [Bacteroidota bacterium]|nr:hypothetical protein [Bacteroidota bacterium]
METATLREKLHAIIDNSPTEKLEEIYQLINVEDYSDIFKSELDEEYSSYQKDGETLSKKEIDTMITELLHKKK